MVWKTCDVCRLLEQHMCLWKEEKFEELLQESSRCDKVLCKAYRCLNDEEHTAKIFTKLMLLGKVKAVMRWVTERITGGLLNPSNIVSSGGNSTSMSVMDVLRNKHPEPLNPC